MTRAEGILAALLLATLAWGIRERDSGRAGRRQLEASIAARDSAARVWDGERAGLEAGLATLRQDSAALEGRRRAAARLAGDSIGKLLALIPDSGARAIASSAVDLQAGETAACQAQLTNCEARAANAEARARGDSSSLASMRIFVHDTLEVRWRDAERRAQPNALRDLWRSRSLSLPLAAVSFVAGMLLRR